MHDGVVSHTSSVNAIVYCPFCSKPFVVDRYGMQQCPHCDKVFVLEYKPSEYKCDGLEKYEEP